MKNIIKTTAVAIALASAAVASAQQMPPIPVDPNVRIGKLDNGLTYYIRHNDFNKQRADFYIAQKVGSILEEDNQRGLAHFLEHMCFNGTENFPGNSLISYLEGIGVKFGQNLNAYTSVDETVYNISDVPVTREAIVDSCLLILHDWADGLTLDHDEIDKERGVINEEWRSRTGAMTRMWEKAFPIIFPDSKYAYRLPIGTMDVILNFPYQALRDYYEKWYRPDQQGVIVVGDIDVDKVEAKIKEMFSPIKMPENPAERVYYPVADNKEPLIAIEKDKEQTNYMVYVYHKHEAIPNEQKTTVDYLIYDYAKRMIANMLQSRFTEISMKPNPPYLGSGCYDGDFILAKTKQVFTTVAICKQEDIDRGLESLLEETARMQKFGFTAGEYDRARSEFLSQIESSYNDRNKRKNASFVNEYVRHFIDNEPIPSLEDYYQMMSQTVNMIPVEAINQLIPTFISDSNMVVTIYCPDKEGMRIPTTEEVAGVIDSVKNKAIEPYVDTTPTEPLMSEQEMPTPGKIVEEKDGPLGTKVLTLSNGIKVYLKDTDLKDDEILMEAVSRGGKSLVATADLRDADMATTVVQLGGISHFSMVDLNKVLAGKQAQVAPSIKDATERMSGSSTIKDFETMLQLNYLYFTAPREDKETVNTYMQSVKGQLANQDLDPNTAFSDSLTKVLYAGNPRKLPALKAADIDKINVDNAMRIYKERFANPGDFTFLFIGNLDGENVRPLIEKYIGGLKTTSVKEKFNKKNIASIAKGHLEKTFDKAMETPKTTVIEMYAGKMKYNLKNDLATDIVFQLFDMIYTETIRENLGGTYGVSVAGGINDIPAENYVAQIYFLTDASKCDTTVAVVREQIEKFIKEGPNMEDFAKVKEFMTKSHNEQLKENGYWLSTISSVINFKDDKHTNYLETLQSITPKDLVKAAKEMFKEQNKKQLIMKGVAK